VDFADRIIVWQRAYGRNSLPWQGSDPYRIWLSEIMLQQTQVNTVIPYFERFILRFPDISSLAEASQEAILETWAGLGYYARARNLHHCAQLIVSQFEGKFPDNAASLQQLPGIGRSTAAAIAAFGFGERAAILDGNVRRVLCRHFAVEGPSSEARVLSNLWKIAERELPAASEISAYTQGLMDLGSIVCTRTNPDCSRCPISSSCCAFAQGRQAELPSPRARKTVPQRDVAFVFIKYQGNWLLERRPQRGIWGGLLAPPTLADRHLDAAEIQEMLNFHLSSHGFSLLNYQPAPKFSHLFTHFKLNIQPWICEVQMLNADIRRLTPITYSAIGIAALPAPVKQFLAHISTSSIFESQG
jgi:A/G-specific adenine glycosylase